MLTRDTMTGPWAGLPVAWTDDDRFDEATYRADVVRCCQAGMPGVYTGGTTGEFYAQELDEFRAIARATVEECHSHNKPAMIGCSSTYTRGAMLRAEYAASLGADAIQVALPFWMEIHESQIVPFFQQVSSACGHLPLSVYETNRAKRALTIEQHQAVHAALPNYLMVKATAGTIGSTPEGCTALSKIINVFVGEHLWGKLGLLGACGGCSSLVYWNPRVTLAIWKQVESRDWSAVSAWCDRLKPLFEFLFATFGARGFTDSAYDRLGAVAGTTLHTSLRCRPPYPFATPADVETLRAWYRKHLPEMVDVMKD